MKTAFHKVRITGEPNSILKHVYLDDQEIKGVVAATVCYSVDSIPAVFLEMQTLDIEIDEPEAKVYQFKNTEYKKVYVEGKTDSMNGEDVNAHDDSE